jgi:hypothetical protein
MRWPSGVHSQVDKRSQCSRILGTQDVFRLTGLCDRTQLKVVSDAQSPYQASHLHLPVQRMTLILSRALPYQKATFADGANSR